MSDILQQWSATVALSLCVSAVSVTVGRTKIFADMRDWIDARSSWLGDLVSCPYCLSHWLSIIVTVWYRPRLVRSTVAFADFAVSAFVIVALAAFFAGLIVRAFRFSDA